MPITEAMIAEETARLSIILTAVKSQYAAEKGQMIGIGTQLQNAAAMIQQLDSGIYTATEGSNIGYREAHTSLTKAANDVRSASSQITGLF